MDLNEETIKLILGLKIKQSRLDRNITLSELAEKSGISISYLTEIEKGKKQPKPSKVAAIAEALGLTYDWLVSLQLNKRMAPIGELIKSNMLKELPLSHFGLDVPRLIDLFATAPTKLAAFINTLIEISRSHDLKVEQFYFSALRSYQEMHENYFKDLEEAVEKFNDLFGLDPNQTPTDTDLEKILTNEFKVNVLDLDTIKYPELKSLRTVYKPSDNPTLYINPSLSPSQRAFALGRELGFAFLKITKRPLTSSWIKIISFDEVLNNFEASYFSGALLINRDRLVNDIAGFFRQTEWSGEKWGQMALKYNASPEMFLHRLTSILPKFFNINHLFFLRFNNIPGTKEFKLSKELHLSGLHNPHANFNSEHYCRRWVSLTIMDELKTQVQNGKYTTPVTQIQFSDYADSDNKYVVISMARPMNPSPDSLCSVSLGIKFSENFADKIKFLKSANLPRRTVSETCERCPIKDCESRAAEDFILQQKLNQRKMINKLEDLLN